MYYLINILRNAKSQDRPQEESKVDPQEISNDQVNPQMMKKINPIKK